MALIPLSLPPGMYRNGTEYSAAGRWRDGNLVRWHEGVLRPLKGWSQRTQIAGTPNPPRGAWSWKDTASDRWLAIGTANALYVMNASNTFSTITPAGLTAGLVDGTANTGYGGGFYGLYSYGTERPDLGVVSEATTWSLDNWGSNLLACSHADGRLVEWTPGTSTALPLANAPTSNLGLLVTEERFVFALGADSNPRLIRWSDRENNTLWTPASTNEAGDIELQTSGEIMLGIRTRGQALILTDQDAHAATYQGPPFVYGFERVGGGCGAISRHAAATTDQGAFWMSRGGFFRFAGGAVERLPSDVSDYVFGRINRNQMSKVHAVQNSAFNEVWWFYPSTTSECDSYVVFNYVENHWVTGYMARAAAVDLGVFRNPVWLSSTGEVLDHEVGLSFQGDTAYIESGPYTLGAGDQVLSALSLIPDELTQGESTMTFKTRFHPNDTERSYGPYSMANPTDVRFTGRQVVMRIDGAPGASWRVGTPRLDVTPGGRR